MSVYIYGYFVLHTCIFFLQALNALAENKNNIAQWRGKYFTPPANARLPSGAGSWDDAKIFLEQRLEHVTQSSAANEEVQEAMTKILQVSPSLISLHMFPDPGPCLIATMSISLPILLLSLDH